MLYMKNMSSLFVIIIVIHVTIIAFSVEAEMITGCHCFKHRSYDSKSKFLADDYILATSFNSLTAAFFNISKKQIIRLKMKGGVNQNDLLISLKLGKDCGVEHQQQLKLRQEKYSWQKIVSESEILSIIKNNDLLIMIKDGKSNDVIGLKVANSMIADFYNVSEKTVSKLRSQGFNEKELALFFQLVRRKQVKPEVLIKQIKVEGQSWSEVAHELDITPAMAGKLIATYGK